MIPHSSSDLTIDCTMCGHEVDVADLCEHDDPMCSADCLAHHGDDSNADRFREWERLGWSA
jgi:hypothetical protein